MGDGCLPHTKWECKYHVVWMPKYRKKTLYVELRIHTLISMPPRYSVSQVVGYLKGKSAVQIARTYMGRKKNFTGQHFWARGYFVSTVGADEKTVRDYIRRQETEDYRLVQLGMFEE